MTLQDYIQIDYPDIAEEYKRLTTPNYYECGVEYYPLRSGFGGTGKKYKTLVFKNITLFKNNVFHARLYDKDNPKDSYIINSSSLHKDLVRVDENIEYKENLISDKRIRYIVVDGVEYQIRFDVWREYQTQKIRWTVIVSSESFKFYYNYYNRTGVPCLTYHPTGKIDKYDFYRDCSVRKFKEIVFGNSNIKI